jgi:hypothetical protein
MRLTVAAASSELVAAVAFALVLESAEQVTLPALLVCGPQVYLVKRLAGFVQISVCV